MIYISYRDARGFVDMHPSKNLKEVPLFIIKILIIATHLATLLLSVTLDPQGIKKKIF